MDINTGILIMNGKYSLVEKDGKYYKDIIPCIYDCINNNNNGLFTICKNGHSGVADKNGNIIIPIILDYIIFLSNHNLICGIINKGCILFDTTGEIVVPLETYDKIDTISNTTLLRVMKDGKYGLINNKGEEILPCSYPRIDRMSYICKDGNLFIITKSNKSAIMNQKGEMLTEFKYDSNVMEDSSHKYICVKEINGKYGFIDKENLEFIPFTHIIPLSSSSFRLDTFLPDIYFLKYKNNIYIYNNINFYTLENFKKDDIIYYTNKEDNILFKNKIIKQIESEEHFEISKEIKSKFDETYYISSNLLKVKLDDKFGFVNNLGEEVIPVIYSDIEYSDLNLIKAYKSGAIGSVFSEVILYNSKGKQLIDKEIDWMGGYDLENNIMKFRYADRNYYKYGVIKIENDEAIIINKKAYDDINVYDIKFGLIEVISNGKVGAINIKGEEVIPLVYNKIQIVNEKYYIGYTLGKYGLCKIDEKSFEEFISVSNIDLYWIKYNKDYLFILNGNLFIGLKEFEREIELLGKDNLLNNKDYNICKNIINKSLYWKNFID